MASFNDMTTAVSKALCFLDNSLLGMGDYYGESVEYLCDEAGLKYRSWDDDDEEDEEYDDNYDNIMAIKAYKILLDREVLGQYKLINSIVDYYTDNSETFIKQLLYYNQKGIKSNTIIKAVEAITKYTAYLVQNGHCDKSYYDKMYEMLQKLYSIDLEVCVVAYDIAQNYFNYFNERYYMRSNDVYTMGHIILDNESERELGPYVMHASLQGENLPHNEGYTIAFDRNASGQIEAKLYEFTRNFNEHTIENKDTGVRVVVNSAEEAKLVAAKLNELTEKKYGNTIKEETRSVETEVKAPEEKQVESNKNSFKPPSESENYKEFIENLIKLIERTLDIKEEDRFKRIEKTVTKGELTWLTGTMGNFIYKGKRCYIDFTFNYSLEGDHGTLVYFILQHDVNEKALAEDGCSFDKEGMQVHFSKMLKSTQKFILGIKKEMKKTS